MAIFEMLRTDHRKVKQELEQCQRSLQQGEQVQMESILRVRDMLLPHMQAEEKFLYPALSKQTELEDAIRDSYKDHQQMREILGRLEKTDPVASRDMLQTDIKRLLDVLNEHVDEEENEIFPTTEEVLPKEQIRDIENQIEQLMQQERAKQMR